MTYQDKLINEHLRTFELAAIAYAHGPSVKTSQDLAVARHKIVKFIKESSK